MQIIEEESEENKVVQNIDYDKFLSTFQRTFQLTDRKLSRESYLKTKDEP